MAGGGVMAPYWEQIEQMLAMGVGLATFVQEVCGRTSSVKNTRGSIVLSRVDSVRVDEGARHGHFSPGEAPGAKFCLAWRAAFAQNIHNI